MHHSEAPQSVLFAQSCAPRSTGKQASHSHWKREGPGTTSLKHDVGNKCDYPDIQDDVWSDGLKTNCKALATEQYFSKVTWSFSRYVG